MAKQQFSEMEARTLIKGEYGTESLKCLAHYAVPFFIAKAARFSSLEDLREKDLREENKILVGGTAFFVGFGDRPYGVTAYHVITEALGRDVALRGLFPVQYEGPAKYLLELADLDSRIIAQDKTRDIATFKVSQTELERLGVSVLSAAPVVPVKGRGVGFAGFPGAQRELVNLRHHRGFPVMDICVAVFVGVGIATAVSDRQITYQFERDYLETSPGFDLPPPDFDLGGMSGGPLLMKMETQSGFEFWRPAGVITQGDMLPGLGSGFLYAARADCLREDGSIEPYYDPRPVKDNE